MSRVRAQAADVLETRPSPRDTMPNLVVYVIQYDRTVLHTWTKFGVRRSAGEKGAPCVRLLISPKVIGTDTDRSANM